MRRDGYFCEAKGEFLNIKMEQEIFLNASKISLDILSKPCEDSSRRVGVISPMEYYSVVERVLFTGDRKQNILWFQTTAGWIHSQSSNFAAFTRIPIGYYITSQELQVYCNFDSETPIESQISEFSTIQIEKFIFDPKKQLWGLISPTGWIKCVGNLKHIKEPSLEMIYYQNQSPLSSKLQGRLPIREDPSFESSKIDYLAPFAIVQSFERRLVDGQMWIHVGTGWVIETNAVTGYQVLVEYDAPSLETRYYRNIYPKRALPVRRSSDLTAQIDAKLPIGHVFVSNQRYLNKCGQMWIQCPDGGWVIERNSKTNQVSIMSIDPPQMKRMYYQIIFDRMPLHVLPQPDWKVKHRQIMTLRSPQVFECNERRLNTTTCEIWLSVVLHDVIIGWVPECLDGISLCVESIPAPSKTVRVKDKVNETQQAINTIMLETKRSFSFDDPPVPPAAAKIEIAIEPPSGLYSGDVKVILNCKETVYYTLDGERPDASSLVYDPTIGIHLESDSISRIVQVRAIGICSNGQAISEVVEREYQIQPSRDCATICTWLMTQFTQFFRGRTTLRYDRVNVSDV